MIIDGVTARYAGALYNVAQRTGALDRVSSDVEEIARELASPATRHVVFNPRVERAAKRQQLAPLVARLSPLAQNFVHLLLDKHREDVLKGLAQAFRRRTLEEQGAVEGVVESPRPIGQRELGEIATALGAELGKRLYLTNRIVPELVGGARVIAGNRMIDASIQGRLEGLRRQMMEARLPSRSARSSPAPQPPR